MWKGVVMDLHSGAAAIGQSIGGAAGAAVGTAVGLVRGAVTGAVGAMSAGSSSRGPLLAITSEDSPERSDGSWAVVQEHKAHGESLMTEPAGTAVAVTEPGVQENPGTQLKPIREADPPPLPKYPWKMYGEELVVDVVKVR